MNKTLKICNGIALVVTIVINYLSNTGVFNGNTMKTISDKYHNYFTPAGYAFSIWGLIYLGLLGFVFYTGRSLFTNKETPEEDDTIEKIGWWFTISCICNSLWIIAWLYEYTAFSVLLMILLLFALLKIVVNARMELDYHPLKKYALVFWPFAIYTGWVSVALIADIAAWLTKIDWNGWGISEVAWSVIMIVVAGLLNVFMIWKRNMREYALAGIWALIAISVANKNDHLLVVYSCYIMAAIILIGIMVSGYKSRKSSIKAM